MNSSKINLFLKSAILEFQYTISVTVNCTTLNNIRWIFPKRGPTETQIAVYMEICKPRFGLLFNHAFSMLFSKRKLGQSSRNAVQYTLSMERNRILKIRGELKYLRNLYMRIDFNSLRLKCPSVIWYE